MQGCPCGLRFYQPQGPKNAIKITHLGINIKVITCFTNGFTNIKKITSFTKIIVKVGNHKNMKLVKNKPECLWPLEIQNKYNK